MIKFQIKWQYLTALICGLLISLFLIYHYFEIQKLNLSQKINLLESRADSLAMIDREKIVQFRDRIKTNTKIVNKWNNVYSVDSFTSIDTLFLEAKTDINYLDSSLKICSSSLDNCRALVSTQKELNESLNNQNKQPLFVKYVGVGVSLNKDLIVQPTINAGIGMNLDRLFKK